MLASEDRTRRLLQFSFAYFLLYIVFGVSTKYFIDPAPGYPNLSGMEFLLYSTFGGMITCLTVVVARGWCQQLKSRGEVRWGSLRFPQELLWLVPSGVCTAVVIPTTTMMYTLPVKVMVAMTLMRASVIVVSRVVDEILIRQGRLKKKVLREENIAAALAFSTVFAVMFLSPKGGFSFIHSTLALVTMSLYICSYAIRIYIMRRTQGMIEDRPYFGIEQVTAAITVMAVVGGLFIFAPRFHYWNDRRVAQTILATITWNLPAIVAGVSFGAAAFFSVFLLRFKGTGTFAVVVNRNASLFAGTAATLIYWSWFTGKFPDKEEWCSFGLLLLATRFLVKAEQRRRIEGS